MRSEENDDLFRSAYEEFEQKPSGDAWQKMNARLDSKAIASYKRRIQIWRSVAVLLFLLCLGFFLSQNPFSVNGAQRQFASTKSKQSVVVEKKSSGFKEAFSTGKLSQPGNRITKDHAVDIARIADPMTDFSMDNQSINSSEDPSPSIILLHSFPLPSHWSTSTAGMPTPRDPNKQLIIIQKDVKHSSAWTLTGFVTYERANYRLDNDLPPSYEKSLIQQREEHEVSFSTGVLASLQLRKRWSMQTGLIYSNTSIGIKPEIMYASHDGQGNIAFKYVTSSGYAYVKAGFRPSPSSGDSLTTAVAQHNLQSVSIPFSVRYNISNQRLLVQPGVGVAVNFFTSTKVVTEIEEASHRESVIINKLEGTRPLYLSLVADANLQYSLNNRWSVNLIPMFKYALTPITKDHVVQTFPYSIGVGGGATLKF